jgi:hypothetical protein
VNGLDVPVHVTFGGGYDTGTIAPFLFQWIDGWNPSDPLDPAGPLGYLLDPGAAVEFALFVGMPADVPMAAAKTNGVFGFTWQVTALGGPAALPPVANDDAATVEAGEVTTIDLLANDTNLDGGATVELYGYDPAQGTWTDNGDGTVTFQPAAGFHGVATANYTVTTAGGTDEGAIAITVNAPVVTTPETTEPPVTEPPTVPPTNGPDPTMLLPPTDPGGDIELDVVTPTTPATPPTTNGTTTNPTNPGTTTPELGGGATTPTDTTPTDDGKGGLPTTGFALTTLIGIAAATIAIGGITLGVRRIGRMA